MEEGDLNGDGVMDVLEFSKYLNIEDGIEESDARLPDWFQEMDANANGFIELLELDSDYNQ
jgi:Ca2+-binding EF-hand superfamily protein